MYTSLAESQKKICCAEGSSGVIHSANFVPMARGSAKSPATRKLNRRAILAVVIAGVVGMSPYPNHATKAPAPPCTLLTFAGRASRAWCKYPFCPHGMPPQPAPPDPTDGEVPLTLLPQDAGPESPANLDGSPYGVYFAKSRSGKSSKWTVSIEGGGWCYGEASCLSRSTTNLGSSRAWPKALPFSPEPYGVHFKQWEMGCMNAQGPSSTMTLGRFLKGPPKLECCILRV